MKSVIKNNRESQRLNPSAIGATAWRLSAIAASQSAAQAVLPALVPAILAGSAVPVSVLGAAFGLGTVLLALAAPAWARRADRVGPASVLKAGLSIVLLTQILFALAVLLLVWSPGMRMAGLSLLLLTRMAYGLGAAGVYPACQAWASAGQTGSGRMRALASVSAGGNLGRALGPGLALLALPLGLFAPLLWLPLLAGVALLLLHGRPAPPNPAPAAATAGRPRFPTALLPWMLLAFSITAAIAQLQILLGPVLVEHFGRSAAAAAREVSLCLVLAAALGGFVQLGPLRRLGRPAVAVGLGLVVLLASAFGLATAPLAPGLIAAAAGLGVGAAILAPAYSTLAADRCREDRRSAAFAYLAMAHTAGYTVGFVSGGSWFDLQPGRPMLGVVCCVLLACGAAALGLWRLRAAA